MYPTHWARTQGGKPAVINAHSGESISWKALDGRSNQVAHALRRAGLSIGDHLALLMENHLEYFEIAWAAFRAGLYITCINRYLTAEEAAYIVNDSGARAIISSGEIGIAAELAELIPNCPVRLMSRGTARGWESYEESIHGFPTTPLADEAMGDSMLYSSGTTGRPKGVKRPLTGSPVEEGVPNAQLINPYGFNEHSRYLSPAPLYHAAPFGFCMRASSLGGTILMMERFDPLLSLQYIEQYRVTHSQWVPTMFIRMLKLEEAERTQFDLSSHVCAIHAAAPCPISIKRQMIDWWGPILWEYYAGTERNGSTIINSKEWLAHPGSVGRVHSGVIHICDAVGRDLPAGTEGLIYFEQPSRPFEYHNSPDKTSEATHPEHVNWTSLGDVGYLDEDGYLYLTDRKAFLIISGGVNIYPREIEDVLVVHPKVADVAVFGIPNQDFGEEVKAVVQPADGVMPGPALAEVLTSYARERLAGFKVPRSFDFIEEMPRLPTGKLYKRVLRDNYGDLFNANSTKGS